MNKISQRCFVLYLILKGENPPQKAITSVISDTSDASSSRLAFSEASAALIAAELISSLQSLVLSNVFSSSNSPSASV